MYFSPHSRLPKHVTSLARLLGLMPPSTGEPMLLLSLVLLLPTFGSVFITLLSHLGLVRLSTNSFLMHSLLGGVSLDSPPNTLVVISVQNYLRHCNTLSFRAH